MTVLIDLIFFSLQLLPLACRCLPSCCVLTLSFLCEYLHLMSLTSFCENTRYIELGRIHMISVYLNYFFKAQISKCYHILRYWRQELQPMNLGCHIIQPVAHAYGSWMYICFGNTLQFFSKAAYLTRKKSLKRCCLHPNAAVSLLILSLCICSLSLLVHFFNTDYYNA